MPTHSPLTTVCSFVPSSSTWKDRSLALTLLTRLLDGITRLGRSAQQEDKAAPLTDELIGTVLVYLA